jgi:predicted MFS family arabinose efflux permease
MFSKAIEARTAEGARHSSVTAALFLSLFAAQAGLIALSPVLAQLASDLGVSTAAAGQLRTISGLAAGVTALSAARMGRRFGLRRLLLAGAAMLALGSLASAGAPSFAALAAAQVLIGVAVAVLVTAGTTAAAEWAPREHRARVLSWALIGQAAAWIVGMPLIGALGEASWRYAWLALPLAASLLAGVAVARRPDSRQGLPSANSVRTTLADHEVRRWAIGELLASSGWVGTLVFAGALFTESYGISLTLVGVILAGAGAAYVAGNLAFRRLVARESQRLLAQLPLALALAVLLFAAVRLALPVSAILLSASAFLAGGRTLLSSAVGLKSAPERRLALMGLRGAAIQFGYLVGSGAGGIGLALLDYAGLGLVLAVLFVAAAVALMPSPSTRFAARGARPLAGRATARLRTEPSPCS